MAGLREVSGNSCLIGGMEMKKRVLLVIDVLNDFLNPAGALYCGNEARKIIPVIRSLIEEFTAEGEPVVSQGCPR
jgi:nicotinamidase-related amidase